MLDQYLNIFQGSVGQMQDKVTRVHTIKDWLAKEFPSVLILEKTGKRRPGGRQKRRKEGM